MKKLIVVLITLAAFSLCNGDDLSSQNNAVSIDELGAQVFKLIQSNKFNKILELRPDLIEYTAVMNNSSFSESKKKEMISKVEYFLERDTESLKKSYDLFIENSESAGIDWSNSSLNYIDYEHIKKNKIEIADIYLNIDLKGVNYIIELEDCVKAGDTWLVGNEIYCKGLK